MKDKITSKLPDYSYKESGIDNFYWVRQQLGHTEVIPLIKPYKLINSGSPKVWGLTTNELYNEFGNVISPILFFNVEKTYIYGYKSFEKNEIDVKFNSPEKWFIINTQERKLIYFDKESEFKAELKKLNLPEEYLNPEEVFEQYKNDPVLPWFPEDIKKQLEDVKNKKK